jgi:hypothetical protein
VRILYNNAGWSYAQILSESTPICCNVQYNNELDTANLKVAESLEAAADAAEGRRRTAGHLSEVMRGLVVAITSARSQKTARQVLLKQLVAANEGNTAVSKELRVLTAQV